MELKRFVTLMFGLNLAGFMQLYDQIFIADKVEKGIKKWRDSYDSSLTINPPTFYLEEYKKRFKIVNLSDFSSKQQATIRVGFVTLTATQFVSDEGNEKNHGEIYTALYAQEMAIGCIVSDDGDAREVIEEYFELVVHDHYDILYYAMERGLRTEEQVQELYRKIENLPGSHPKRRSFSEMMDFVRERFKETA